MNREKITKTMNEIISTVLQFATDVDNMDDKLLEKSNMIEDIGLEIIEENREQLRKRGMEKEILLSVLAYQLYVDAGKDINKLIPEE